MIGVLRSLGATMSTLMRKPVTIQYPTEHRQVPERKRNMSAAQNKKNSTLT